MWTKEQENQKQIALLSVDDLRRAICLIWRTDSMNGARVLDELAVVEKEIEGMGYK